MRCPHCHALVPDKAALKLISKKAILAESGAIRGSRGRGQSKARDPVKMSAAGKLGGRPKKTKTPAKRHAKG